MSLFVDIKKNLGDFCLSVRFETDGGVLGILGASGCGKSMTLKCIAGIERPASGRIVLDGVTLFDSEKGINLPVQQRRVGYLFQSYALFPNMTVRQNILCGLHGEKDKAKKEEINSYYKLALPIYEHLRKIDDGTDPDVKNAWTNGLYTCYYMLNMGKEFEEIEKIINM